MPQQNPSTKNRRHPHPPRAQSKSQIKAQRAHQGTSPSSSPRSPPLSLPAPLQQSILDTYANAFFPHPTSSSSSSSDGTPLNATIQSVKRDLYERGFVRAFDSEEKREAYALRWSVTRAAGYAAFFVGYKELLLPGWGHKGGDARGDVDQGLGQEGGVIGAGGKIVCLGGGGGGEMIGLYAAATAVVAAAASSSSWVQEEPLGGGSDTAKDPRSEISKQKTRSGRDGLLDSSDITITDSADWRSVISNLHSSFFRSTTAGSSFYTSAPPALSPANESNPSPLPSSPPTPHFLLTDILTLNPQAIANLFTPIIQLVTLFFALNELYSASPAAMTAFLLAMTDSLPQGARLCVVDSPGSYACVKLSSRGGGQSSGGGEDTAQRKVGDGEGKEEGRKYPMGWLLDHTLLELASRASSDEGESVEKDGASGRGNSRPKKERVRKWEKLVEEESRWFRWDRSEGLKYREGLELEDMRFQVHIYQRV